MNYEQLFKSLLTDLKISIDKPVDSTELNNIYNEYAVKEIEMQKESGEILLCYPTKFHIIWEPIHIISKLKGLVYFIPNYSKLELEHQALITKALKSRLSQAHLNNPNVFQFTDDDLKAIISVTSVPGPSHNKHFQEFLVNEDINFIEFDDVEGMIVRGNFVREPDITNFHKSLQFIVVLHALQTYDENGLDEILKSATLNHYIHSYIKDDDSIKINLLSSDRLEINKEMIMSPEWVSFVESMY